MVLLVGLIATSALASPPPSDGEPDLSTKIDNRIDPLTAEQAELKAKAMDSVLNGKATTDGKTLEVAKGQFVELAREGEDPVWTVLGEFGDFPHNNIAEPDRDTDNTTIWTEDFNRDYFLDLLFAEGQNSMRDFYIEQSSNRYTVHGDVTDWDARTE